MPNHALGVARHRPRRLVRAGALIAVICSAAFSGPVGAAPTSRSSSSGGSWTTYGGGTEGASVQLRSPVLHPIRARWRSVALDGGIYGEPLISGRRVFVATENNSVYALNASTGTIEWRRTLPAPVPASALPCGDIAPTVGVTSTMVIDPATGRLFASASIYTRDTISHVLYAISPTTGKIVFRRDLDQPGWDAPTQLQRTALGLDNGRVLVGFGGNYGDCGAYNGYLMSVPTTGSGATVVYKVPTDREGAIWAPSGVSVDPAGHIFLATGNGSSQSTRDGGDSVIELDSSLREVGSFTPSDWRRDNASDLDLGSSAPILVSNNRVFIVGKETTGYLLNAANLGGLGGQLTSARICFASGGDAYRGSTIYVGCPNSSVTAARISGNSLVVAWHAPNGVSGSPTIAGGLVWAIGSGNLVGMRFGSGTVVASIPVDQVEHFAAPSAGDGLLVVAGTSKVQAFEGPQGYRP